MKRKILLTTGLVAVGLLVSLPVFAGLSRSNNFVGLYNSLPEPRLSYPISDKVALDGNEPLEFRWHNELMGIDHFIFKLYKGYNMYESGLIYTESLSADTSSKKIKSELFEDGQVYTWSLVQVSLQGQKSDKSFNSFKVQRK